MTNRLLAEGTDVSYGGLMGKLQGREMLAAATWVINSSNDALIARPVLSQSDFEQSVAKTKNGDYNTLYWFASTTGSVDYSDYNM